MLRFYQNGAFLDTHAYCTFEGSKQTGSFRPSDYLVDDEAETKCKRWETIRECLIRILGDSDFDLSMELFAQGMTCQDLANMFEIDKGTACRYKRRLASSNLGKLVAAATSNDAAAIDLQTAFPSLCHFCRDAIFQTILAGLKIDKHCAIVSLPRMKSYFASATRALRSQQVRQFDSLPSSKEVWEFVRGHRPTLFAPRRPSFLGLWYQPASCSWHLGCIDFGKSRPDIQSESA